MSTIILATAIDTDPTVRSSIAHAATAAKECIRRAGVAVEEIDVLVNTGTYRDDNMMEPSMAALVQREIGLNLDYVKYKSPKAAFSFDLMNGSTGVLNAVQVASAMLAIGSAKYVLVVSGDGHPSKENVASFPYAPMGAAMLLAQSTRADEGFGRVKVASSMEDFVGVESVAIVGEGVPNPRGSVVVTIHPELEAHALTLAAKTAYAYAAAEKVDLRNVVLVTSQPTPDFGIKLARRLEIDEARVARSTAVGKDPHSSALTLGFDHASTSGMLAAFPGAPVLFVGVSAGLTSACAVYRR